MADRDDSRVDLYGRDVPAEASATGASQAQVPVAETPITGSFNAVGSSFFGKPSVMLPVGAYHFDSSGHHVSGFNETRNFGLGVSAPFNSSLPVLKDMSAFAVAYRSSYADMPNTKGDIAVVAGVNWDPLKVDMGALRASTGLTAGVAYTTYLCP